MDTVPLLLNTATALPLLPALDMAHLPLNRDTVDTAADMVEDMVRPVAGTDILEGSRVVPLRSPLLVLTLSESGLKRSRCRIGG